MVVDITIQGGGKECCGTYLASRRCCFGARCEYISETINDVAPLSKALGDAKYEDAI